MGQNTESKGSLVWMIKVDLLVSQLEHKDRIGRVYSTKLYVYNNIYYSSFGADEADAMDSDLPVYVNMYDNSRWGTATDSL